MPESDKNTAPDVSQESASRSATAAERRRPTATQLWRAFWRPTAGNMAVGVCMLFFATAATLVVRHTSTDDSYTTSRRDDLIQLLGDLGNEANKLSEDIAEYESTKRQLESGVDSRRVVQEEVDALGVLAGVLPATGPGIRLTLIDPQSKITAAMLVDAIQELRDAGAEVIEMNDKVRLTTRSSVVPADGGGVIVDGVRVQPPYVFEAIGEGHDLAEGARFRGGIVSQVQAPSIGGDATASIVSSLVIDSVATLPDPKFAKPAK